MPAVNYGGHCLWVSTCGSRAALTSTCRAGARPSRHVLQIVPGLGTTDHLDPRLPPG